MSEPTSTPVTTPESTTGATESTVPAISKEDRQKGINAAYGEATTKLRNKYADEFKQLHIAACAERGIDYRPKRSGEEAAAAAITEALTKYPALAAQLKAELGAQG